ncbi:histone deacetylase family protein [Desertibaculum subflavum]|uniref:histone deacetylase family protein n=1 Tax=Desertibaculum subflavum TaxID=2268458 RepID=UPI000E66F651
MTTTLITHAACLAHDTGSGHPERSDRLRAVLQALDHDTFRELDRREAPLASLDELVRVHDATYVDLILGNVPAHGHVMVDGDTVMSPGSGEAALRAAGAVCAAVDAVTTGAARNAFCAVRPPGHHAEPGRAMGFCLFNNVAVGAQHARARHGMRRVAVIDFDVHHGNGTQAAFESDRDLFYASTHQSPLYPGTGDRNERGVGDNILNVPLPPGAGSDAFRHAIERDIVPALDAFRPELVMISAGFDAHRADPLASLGLTEADFAFATTALCDVARRHAGGKVVSTLEGGYNLVALAASAAAHVKALMEG